MVLLFCMEKVCFSCNPPPKPAMTTDHRLDIRVPSPPTINSQCSDKKRDCAHHMDPQESQTLCSFIGGVTTYVSDRCFMNATCNDDRRGAPGQCIETRLAPAPLQFALVGGRELVPGRRRGFSPPPSLISEQDANCMLVQISATLQGPKTTALESARLQIKVHLGAMQ